MCQTKRPRSHSPNARKKDKEAVYQPTADVDSDAKKSPFLLTSDDNNNYSIVAKEARKEVKSQLTVTNQPRSIQNSEMSNQQGKSSTKYEPSQKWDAFASLENNYESSDSSEDESDSDSDVGEHQYKDDRDGHHDEIKSQWNAFKSLESTLGDDSSNSSDSGEESDCILIESEDERKMPHKSPRKMETKIDCVDLVDTDDEDMQREEDIKLVARKRKRASNNSSANSLANDDSDSSYISEVESSRILNPSPATRQGLRTLPPWQRISRPKTNSSSILENDNMLPRESFSLLNNRNDINGSGINEARSSAPTSRQPKKRKSSKKSSTSTTRRRKRSDSDSAAPAKKKRRTRKYNRRSSKRGTRSSRGRRGTAAASGSSRSNNAWSARERGIRQPIRDNSGPGGSYMNITKQEPMLRNIGGASIQF